MNIQQQQVPVDYMQQQHYQQQQQPKYNNQYNQNTPPSQQHYQIQYSNNQQNQQQQQQYNSNNYFNLQDDNVVISQMNDILHNLDESEDSIRQARDWMMNNQHKAHLIVELIRKRTISFYDIPVSKIISVIYLINDVLHFSMILKMDGNNEEYIYRFYQVFPIILSHIYYKLDISQKDIIQNMLDLWVERNIYSSDEISNLRKFTQSCPPNITPGLMVSYLRSIQPNSTYISSSFKPVNLQDIDYHQLVNLIIQQQQQQFNTHNRSFYDKLREWYQS